jgi:lysophospholipase L1-like esterase
MGNLIAYGHSWVSGEAASDPSLGFVEAAAQRLGLTPVNRGVGGSHGPDTAELVRREPVPEAELYLVLTGLNDARRHGLEDGALEAYVVALETIFDSLGRAAPAALTVTLGQPLLIDYSFHEPHNHGSNEALRIFNRRLQDVASRFPRVVVGTVEGWDPLTMLDDDTVHPNDLGHAALTEAVISAVVAGRRSHAAPS